MTTTNNSNSKLPGAPVSLVLKAGLLAGTLDICSAFLYGYIKSGVAPQAILQSISKTAFGKTTFSDTTILSLTGLLAHFAIAMCWTILFFILYRWLNFMRLNIILTAIGYGLLIWSAMSMVILPLWNHRPFVFKAENACISALILILAIGLPLSLIAHSYYSKRGNS